MRWVVNGWNAQTLPNRDSTQQKQQQKNECHAHNSIARNPFTQGRKMMTKSNDNYCENERRRK